MFAPAHIDPRTSNHGFLVREKDIDHRTQSLAVVAASRSNAYPTQPVLIGTLSIG
jgi:hypothetical protein